MTTSASSPLLPKLTETMATFNGPFLVKNSDGEDVVVYGFFFERNSHRLDIRFRHAQRVLEKPGYSGPFGHELCHDPVYLTGLNALLARTGHAGAAASPAEREMQEIRVVVLEAEDDFSEFAARAGWWEHADGQEDFWLGRAIKTKLPGSRRVGFEASNGALVGIYESTAVEQWVKALAKEACNKGKTLVEVFEEQVLPAIAAEPAAAGVWAQANLDEHYLSVFQVPPAADPRTEFKKAKMRVL